MNTTTKNITIFLLASFLVLTPYTPAPSAGGFSTEAAEYQNNIQVVSASAATCNPKQDLSFSNVSTSGGQAQSNGTNSSSNCSYGVLMVSYKVYHDQKDDWDKFLETQTVFDSQFRTISPGQSLTLSVNLPSCRYQVDVYEGPNNPPPPATSSDTHDLLRWKIDSTRSLCDGGGSTPPQNTLPEGYHDGNLGTVPVGGQCHALGWAVDPDNRSQDLTVRIYVDGTLKTTTVANRYRSGLESKGKCPGGTCAFAVNLDNVITPNQTHSITAKAVDAQTGEERTLGWSPRTLKCTEEVAPPPPSGNLPVAQTTNATNVTTGSATLNGRVDPNNASTNYWFEYGTNPSVLGSTTPVRSAGSGSNFSNVSRGVTGLSADTTYYFRLVAENTHGRDTGSVLSFTTDNSITPPPPPPPPPAGNAPTAQTTNADNVTASSASLSGRVNPNNASTNYWFEYGTSQSLGSTTGQQFAGSGSTLGNVSRTLTGLQGNTTYYYRVVAENGHGTTHGSMLSFTTDNATTPGPEDPPLVTTNAATQVGQTFGVLGGQVNPRGSNTVFWFEYGTTQGTSQSTQQVSVGSGTGTLQQSEFITGLQENATYYFRAMGRNAHGTTQGSLLSFTTGGDNGGEGDAPIVQTETATSISQNSAQLEGRVNPNNASTQYWFEYGTTQNLGQSTPQLSSGSGNSQVDADYQVSGLLSNTTYYYRTAAQNQNGLTRGSILSFTTGTSGGGSQSPEAVTRSVDDVDANSATLRGRINPRAALSQYWFEYGPTTSLGTRTSFRSAGSGNSDFNVEDSIGGLQSDETYYYRVVVENAHGTTRGSVLSFQTDDDGNGGGDNEDAPDVETLSATSVDENSARLRGEADPNGDDTIAWFEYGTNRNSLVFTSATENIGDGTSDRSFSERVSGLSSNTTYYFRAVARNSEGTVRGSTRSFTTDSNGGGGPSQLPPGVLTENASFVARNSALISGRVDPNNGTTSAWFEYGTTPSLGLNTSAQAMGSGDGLLNYSAALSGLLPNTTYYYRAVAENGAGRVRGSLRTFNTEAIPTGPPTGPPPTPQPPVVVPSGPGAACLTLEPSIDEPALQAESDYLYSLVYRNDCPFTLQNTRLRITLPFEVTFARTNYPILTRDANVITYDLGVVARNFQSVVVVEGDVREEVEDGDSVIFKADVSFNDPDGDLQSVSAFLTAFVEDGGLSVFTANILSTLGDWLGSGWFWLLLLLILLAILGYWYWRKRRMDKAEQLDREERMHSDPVL